MRENFTVQQLARHLQVHINTIYDWLQEGTIFPHAFKIKRGWRIPMADVRRAKQRQFAPIMRKTAVAARNKSSGGFMRAW